MNEILTIISILANYAGILISYKLFKKTGLFCWMTFAYVLANIETLKCIDVFGFSTTLGNVIFCTMVLATDILNEFYGKKEAKKGLWIGFFAMFSFTILTQIDLLFVPNSEDLVNGAFESLFGLVPRICIASFLTYIISNQLDIYVFQKIRDKFPEEKFYSLRKTGSNLVSQFVDSFLFAIIAFLGTYPISSLISIIVTAYIFKLAISTLDLPFMKIAKKINLKIEEGE